MPRPERPAPLPALRDRVLADGRMRAWLLRWECLVGPPEAEKVPFETSPAVPLFPSATARLLAPFDRLVAWCARGAEGPTVCSPAELGADSGEDNREARQDSQSRCRGRLQMAFVTVSLLVLVLCYWAHLFAAGTDLGDPLPLDCSNYFSKYAMGFGASKCGLNASECLDRTSWYAVRCAGWCATKQVHPLVDRVVGNGPFRVDSRICNVGVHAGLIGAEGGCFDVRVGGAARSFAAGKRNGIVSFAFDSWYPLTLEVRASSGSRFCSYGAWWALLLLNLALLFLLTLLRPGRQLFFWSMLTLLYWYVALASSISSVTMKDAMTSLGSFAFFCLACYVFLWKVGGAKHFFADTASGAPFDVMLLEILPALPMMHMHLLALFIGDYNLDGAILKDWRPMVIYGTGAAVVMPAVCCICRQWYRARCLRWLICFALSAAAAIIIMTLIFSTADWGLHIHHYFISLTGYLFARGRSRLATAFRAFCLGAFVNGLVRWGRPEDIPIWHPGSGWLPDSGKVDAAAVAASRAARVVWTAVDVLAGGKVTLAWGLVGDLQKSCDNPPQATGDAAPVYVVEMNHVEVYRGHSTSWTFALPPAILTGNGNVSGHAYFRVGAVNRGANTGISSASRVLAVRSSTPPTEVYYNSSADACQRASVLQGQPPSSLAGFI